MLIFKDDYLNGSRFFFLFGFFNFSFGGVTNYLEIRLTDDFSVFFHFQGNIAEVD